MLKSVFAAASLAVIVANVGCGAAPDSSESTASDQALDQAAAKKTAPTAGTLSLADAQAQVGAIRTKLDPKGDNALLFDATLTQPYLDAVKPVFAQVAVTDKIALASTAFTYTSSAINSGAIFDLGLLDDAVGSFADLWDFASYWGGLNANGGFWAKLDLIVSHSSAAPLSDLQILSLVTNTRTPDVLGGLKAAHWETARTANQVDGTSIPDGEMPFAMLSDALFGVDGYDPAQNAMATDLDTSNAFDVAVFTRSYAELRFLTVDQTDILDVYDLVGHLNTYEQAHPGHKATNALALVKKLFTTSEMKELNLQLTK